MVNQERKVGRGFSFELRVLQSSLLWEQMSQRDGSMILEKMSAAAHDHILVMAERCPA
jgi:hypothetical protein